MKPSEESIAEFLSFAPGADERTAFMFLEVTLTAIVSIQYLVY